MLAGDPPRIGSICPKKTLSGGTTATIWVNTWPRPQKIASVRAVITPPGYLPGTPSGAITDLPTVTLKKSASGKYQASYPGFTTKGTYRISVYAKTRQRGPLAPQDLHRGANRRRIERPDEGHPTHSKKECRC